MLGLSKLQLRAADWTVVMAIEDDLLHRWMYRRFRHWKGLTVMSFDEISEESLSAEMVVMQTDTPLQNAAMQEFYGNFAAAWSITLGQYPARWADHHLESGCTLPIDNRTQLQFVIMVNEFINLGPKRSA